MRASAYPVAILATLLACAAAPLRAQALDDQVRQPLPTSTARPAACLFDTSVSIFGLREPACRALQKLPTRLPSRLPDGAALRLAR